MIEEEDPTILHSLSVITLGNPGFARRECELLTKLHEDLDSKNYDNPLALHQICINLIRNRICCKEFIESRPAKKWMFCLVRCARSLFKDKSQISTFHSTNLHSNYVETFQFIASRFLREQQDWHVALVHCLNITQKLIDTKEHIQTFVDCNLQGGVLMLLSSRNMTVLQFSLEILGRISDMCMPCRRILSDSNTIDVCLQLIPDGDIMTQKLCASLLRILSSEEQACEQIRIYDGVPTLLGLLSIKNSRLQWHVAWTLAQLAEHPETSQEIAQLGGISLIFSVLSNSKPPRRAVSDWIAMLTGLTALLAQLAISASCQSLMCSANGVYILGKLLATRKSVTTDEPIDSWNLFQASIFRALRLMFTFDRVKQMLKKVLPTEIYEKFVDLGNYNNVLEDHTEVARMYDELIEENVEIMKDWDIVNERRQAIGEVGEFELLDQLGAGAFGCVYTVRKKAQSHTENPVKLFALKEIFMTNISDRESDKSFGDMISEVKIIKQQLRHPNIVRYRKTFVDTHKLFIVMDLIQGCSLRDQIIMIKEKKENFEESLIWKILIQMMLALRYLHKEKQIVHRDLKPNNIMITPNNRVVITDFGLAKQKGLEYLKSTAGTFNYSCPEIVQNLLYGEKADIWAFGCCAYEMCQLRPAFHSTNMLTLATQIVEAKYDPMDEMWSEDLRSLIVSCLSPEPSERPDILKVSGLCGPRLLEYLDNVARQQATPSELPSSSSNYNFSKLDEPSSLNSSTSSFKRPGRPKISGTGLLPPINPAPRRNHSMSAGETPRLPSICALPLPRIGDKYSMFPSAPSAIPNRRRVQTCSTEHPARSSSSNDLKLSKAQDGLTVSSNALRPIQDPVLTILNQIHRILLVTDKETMSTAMNHQRRLVEMFRRNLMGREADMVQMKTHLRKLAIESPEVISMNLGFSDFRPVLEQAHINDYLKDQKVTNLTYEQLSVIIQSLSAEKPSVN